MFKKIQFLLLALAMVGVACAQQSNMATPQVANARKNITFLADSVKFWCGTGTNQAIVSMLFDPDEYDTALVWGVRWNGTATAADIMDTLNRVDPRLHISFSNSRSFINDIEFADSLNGIFPEESGMGWMYLVNGVMAAAISSQAVVNNDILDWFDAMAANNSWTGHNHTIAKAVSNPFNTTPEEAVISPSAINYWVGTGSDSAVIAINWATPNTALAWGVRFNDSITLQAAMQALVNDDPRLSIVTGQWGISDIVFVSGSDTLHIADGDYWMYNVNGHGSMLTYDMQQIHCSDFVKWGALAVATAIDENYNYVWETLVQAVSVPNFYDVTINDDDIIVWAGSGNNSAVLAVNWANPVACYAWGVRFSTDSITVHDMMDSVMALDSRFSYTTGTYGVTDILLVLNEDTLRLVQSVTTYNYWLYNLNGTAAQLGYDVQPIVNGDFVKWGDPTCGHVLAYDEYGYPSQIVWTVPVQPAPELEEPEHGPFCGPVGTEGCDALACDQNVFVAWATGCTVERGYEDIATQQARVTYGEDANATGSVTMNDVYNVVSLGDGGVATLTFATPIMNGEGPDFAVFENSFNDYFLELAFVEVSSDGEHFVRFPATSLTQTATQINGTGSVDPTYINNLAGKYRAGYGTPFDLAELSDSANIDINHITHVRIIDVVGSIDPQYGTYDAFGHIINDPYPTLSYSGGFDLAGVGVINQALSVDDVQAIDMTIYPNPARSQVNCSFSENYNGTIEIYTQTGALVKTVKVDSGVASFDVSQIPSGVYIVRYGERMEKLVIRH